MDQQTQQYLDNQFARLATAEDLVSVEVKVDQLLEATNGLTDRVDCIGKKLDSLLYQHQIAERVQRIETVLHDKLHVDF